MEWVEAYLADPANKKNANQQNLIKRRSSVLKRSQSNLSGSSLTVWGRMSSFFGDDEMVQNNSNAAEGSMMSSNTNAVDSGEQGGDVRVWHNYLAVFSAGLSLGLLIASRTNMKST